MRAAQVSTLAVLAGGLALTALFIAAPSPGQRGPFVPKRDDEVLERVMPTPRAPSTPLDEAAGLALAERLLSDARRTNDPRLVGRAQATLALWAGSQTPALRLLRARLAQRQGELGQALAELGDVPDTDAGWQLRSELLFSLARYDESLAACTRLSKPEAECGALTRAVLGQPGEPEDLVQRARARRWNDREPEAVELLLVAIAGVGTPPPEARAELAEVLLDLGRTAEVALLFEGRATLSDRELLDVVLAGDTTRTAELASRMEANRQRGDSTGLRDEARYALLVEKNLSRALDAAEKNWARAKEPEDARWLLECAGAMKSGEAAGRVVAWLSTTKLEWARLRGAR